MKMIERDDLSRAVEALEAGGLIVLPTQRWYMICADATNPEACDRIYDAKRRPTSKSLALIIPNIEAATHLFSMTPHAKLLAKAFWPGDLAMLLPWHDTATGQRRAAVGVPNALVNCDPGVLGELAALSSAPIAATTVNISSNAADPGPAITTDEVESFVARTGARIAYCIEGGICPVANHLTVVDCTTAEVKIVRSGVVHLRAIEAAVGSLAPQRKT